MLLNCHTWYSLRYGTYSEKELLTLAQKFNIGSLALTDINNTSACLNFIRLAPKYNVRPIVGIDFRNGALQQYVGIAKNNDGFLELNQHLSKHLHEKEDFDPIAPSFQNAFIIYPTSNLSIDPEQLKDNEYIGISPKDVKNLPFTKYIHFLDKLVILHTASFRNKSDFNKHRLLRAIDNNTLLSKLSSNEEGQKTDLFTTPSRLEKIFADYPIIIQNTYRLLDSSQIYFDFSKERVPQNQKVYTHSAEEDLKLLKSLCEKGLVYRYGNNIDSKVLERLKKELDIIVKMGFVSYFLINWRIIKYANDNGYYYVGRGSGANSIVAYLLRITDVDPIELDLYFERFINLYRKNPPDFDIDFSWRDRQDVTRFIFEEFEHVALLATYNTFQYKAAVRELGKVFGLPKHEIDVLCSNHIEKPKPDSLHQLVLHYASLIQGMPNYLSIHAGGILISELPIHHFTGTNLPPKGFPTTQFDMVIAEDVGLYKFDILGQRGLGKIKETLEIIAYNHPNEPPIDIHDVRSFKTDPNINNMIKEAQCVGCFYVESPAMRMLLKKLEVDNYLGLVAASSIIRPGVAKSGMMREYILRHRDPARIKKAHPVMLQIMPETYGIMVYQEDVIKVAHYFAGLSLDEADVLRRGMSGKFRSRAEFEKVKRNYFENCEKKSIEKHTAYEIWKQIESFAGYAFAKGHSASYAIESYQTLFLKAYYPLEYMVAILNNGGGFYRSELYVHEARMMGATIQPPCVNTSFPACIIRGKEIFLGLSWLRDLEGNVSVDIVQDRSKNGPFEDLADFVDRIPIGIQQLCSLIRVGAFRFTKRSKRKLLWEAHTLLNRSLPKMRHPKLFRAENKRFSLPELSSTQLEDTFDQIELLGFPLSNPFHLVKDAFKNRLLASNFPSLSNKVVTIYGYLVATKNTSTSNGKRMNFGTFLDQSGYFIDTVHFPPVAAKFPFRGRGVYELTGKVVTEFGFPSLEVSSMQKLDHIEDPRYQVDDQSIANRA